MDFKRDLITRVALSFPTSPELPSNVADKAARILQTDLTVKGPSINSSLVPFARHLDRLSRLDKLSSSSPQLNCYEAIWGIYISLKRIFEREKRVIGIIDERMVEREVMCKHSGRPRMHEGRRLGLSLEYWMERRFVGKEDAADDEDSESRIWALIIECESSPAELYPSIRTSKDWVSERAVKPNDDHHQRDELFDESPDDISPMIDWLEPPPTYLTYDTTDAATNTIGTSQPHPPNVRFIAIFDPPVAVPLQTAYEIYNLVGVQIPQESLPLPIYDELLLERKFQPGTQTQTQGGIRKAVINRDVLVLSDGAEHEEERIRNHQYNIYVQKQYYGKLIEEIPFSHPRQLVEILPVRCSSDLHPSP